MALSNRELTLLGAGLHQPATTLLATLPIAASLIALEAAMPAASNPGVFAQFGASAPYALAWSTGVAWKTVTIV